MFALLASALPAGSVEVGSAVATPPEDRGPRVILAAPDGPVADFALPVPASVVSERELRAPHHDYPASDLMVRTGTPVFAVTAGRVGTHDGLKCGLGVSLVAHGGHRFVFCHLSVVTATQGQTVRAGDVIGLSGDTGNARGVPHLHFHVLVAGRVYVCPQDVLVAWFHDQVAPPAAWHRTSGCFFPRAEGS